MTRKLPPLTWLRAFEASARSRSFTQAATELNLTQAAISKQVKLLELYLREQLFIRNPRSLELTKTGAAYLPKVRDSFDRLAAGTHEVFGRRRSEILTVRCAVGF
jgi:LysR family transcriptional regulator, glycine cleavage system transcriptional activator